MFCRQSMVPWCLKFIPISSMGPKHALKDTYLIFQPIYMHWCMLIRLQRIYNFFIVPCCYINILGCFMVILYHFLGLTY